MENILSEVKKPLTPEQRESLMKIAARGEGSWNEVEQYRLIIGELPSGDEYGDFIKLLKAGAKLLARIKALEAERRWIPVEERLPEYDVDVLCFQISEYGPCVVSILHREDVNGIDEWGDERNFYVKPSHWQPLPSPPDRAQEVKA